MSDTLFLIFKYQNKHYQSSIGNTYFDLLNLLSLYALLNINSNITNNSVLLLYIVNINFNYTS